MTPPAAAPRGAASPGPGGARPRRAPRLAAGRARTLGRPTRGTTAPHRLRRVDRWLLAHLPAETRLVVDLGYGASPVTTVELHSRLAAVRAGVEVVGLELDPERVAAATPHRRPGLSFRRGGFDLSGLRPDVVRAMNVLRQYDEPAVGPAWAAMTTALAPGGLLVEGTCDELGRVGSWVALDPAGPVSLTLAVRLASLDRPGQLAERLPEALIHRNVPGERVHDLLRALDGAWAAAAPLAVFGPRQRWVEAVRRLTSAGWPVLDRPRRWRLGELTVAWSAIDPDLPRS